MPEGRTLASAAALVTIALSAIAPAENWPGWRGPRGDGTSHEIGVPVRWTETDNVAWKVPIPGWSHSSPVVWGDRVLLTTYVEETQERLLLCLDRRDGHTLWATSVFAAPPERRHKLNSHASGTPATDGARVWSAYLKAPDIVLACHNLDGRELWRRSPGTFKSVHGFCTSPVLHDSLVILNCDQDDVAYIVAFDRLTGEERWRADRPNRTRSYCTPLIVEAAGRPQMVLSGSKCVASYNPADGRLLWIIDGPTEQFVASPVWADGVFFVTGGYPERHLIGIRPDGSGDVTHTHILWHHTKDASYVPSPIAHDTWFFVVSDTGVASCIGARTGERPWTERLGRHHSASPVSAEGRLYFPDDDGVTHVIAAGPRFQPIARNPIGEQCRASPAIAGSQIFLRGLRHLHCIGRENRQP